MRDSTWGLCPGEPRSADRPCRSGGLPDRKQQEPREQTTARSLINHPALVLADEPTSSLDTERAFQVVETLANLVHEQNTTGIMVTHDLRMVKYADRVIQMLDGRVERIVSPEDDLACLADPAECRFIPSGVLGFAEETSG